MHKESLEWGSNQCSSFNSRVIFLDCCVVQPEAAVRDIGTFGSVNVRHMLAAHMWRVQEEPVCGAAACHSESDGEQTTGLRSAVCSGNLQLGLVTCCSWWTVDLFLFLLPVSDHIRLGQFSRNHFIRSVSYPCDSLWTTITLPRLPKREI